MQNISSGAELKNAIQLLQVEQSINGQLLKEQFYLTYESLKPINLLKRTLSDVASSPYLIENILGTVAGMASGYLSKKIVVGASHNILRKLFGSVLQFGITNIVSHNPDAVKLFVEFIFQRIFGKKERVTS
jgi:hypothetical protein